MTDRETHSPNHSLLSEVVQLLPVPHQQLMPFTAFCSLALPSPQHHFTLSRPRTPLFLNSGVCWRQFSDSPSMLSSSATECNSFVLRILQNIYNLYLEYNEHWSPVISQKNMSLIVLFYALKQSISYL